jgi:protein-S-isoprenylcysteine O-methyltransferase Ste14
LWVQQDELPPATGDAVKTDIDDIDSGKAPGWLIDVTAAIFGVESDINEAFDDTELKHTYTPTLIDSGSSPRSRLTTFSLAPPGRAREEERRFEHRIVSSEKEGTRNRLAFKLIFSALGIVSGIVRLYYIRRARESGQNISRTRRERFRMPLIAAFSLLAGVAGLMHVVTPRRLMWAELPMPTWSRWSGAVLGAASVSLFLWTHRTLGKNAAAELVIKEEQNLVTGGPYRWVRHPMYTTIVLQYLAFFLLSGNWVMGISGFGVSMLCVARVADEEEMLVEAFGDQYRAYMRRTGRFLPPIRRSVDVDGVD